MSICKINEGMNPYHEMLVNDGWRRNKISAYGVEPKDYEVSYSKDTDDIGMELEAGDPGPDHIEDNYYLIITGDGYDNSIQNREGWTVRTCMKVARKAAKFFEEYPATRKYLEKFAEEWDMDTF